MLKRREGGERRLLKENCRSQTARVVPEKSDKRKGGKGGGFLSVRLNVFCLAQLRAVRVSANGAIPCCKGDKKKSIAECRWMVLIGVVVGVWSIESIGLRYATQG